MKKYLIFFIILIVVLASILILQDTTSQICFQETCFQVERAQTLQERQQGLMFRESLPENQGMLFIFPEPGVYNFWMKDTLIPLDIIWMDEDYNVVHIVTAEPCLSDPCPTYPGKKAKYVLEINSGLANKYNIQIGSQANLK